MKILIRSLGLVAVLAMSTLLPSCDKVKDAITINIGTQTVTADFYITPQETGTKELAIFQYGINIDSLIKIESPDLGIGNIKKAKIQSVNLTFTNATQNDHFGAFSACELGLASSSKPEYTVVAALTSNPETYSTSLDIPVNANVDLKDYFRSSVYYFKFSGTTRRATTTTLQGKATIKFDVEAGL
ncbi:hypothetical protein [Longitalea luteola]|uniref:hypothetical protein n=1 Tax=Longitalea luteola TaxID=2812563 RepID=UPI001A96561B|nr:hypothetical protein [Longitalea luteola]